MRIMKPQPHYTAHVPTVSLITYRFIVLHPRESDLMRLPTLLLCPCMRVGYETSAQFVQDQGPGVFIKVPDRSSAHSHTPIHAQLLPRLLDQRAEHGCLARACGQTLENMWHLVLVFNPLIALLALGVTPLRYVEVMVGGWVGKQAHRAGR